MRIHPEGRPWVLGASLGSAVLALLGRRRAAAGAALAGAALAYFFRDPQRRPPEAPEAVVSPADGEVLLVDTVDQAPWMATPALRIAIFMSLRDVHINRAPATARLVYLAHHPGQFLPAYKEEAGERNERRVYGFEVAGGKRFAMVQVAGIFARRTVPFVVPGDPILRGQRVGLIRFGSRVEVFLPPDARPLVAPGHRVRAGETPIAWWEH